ncbi:MAG: PC4/YdbC family ssDNA-binding protein [Oscillospiraceae bacterium]
MAFQKEFKFEIINGIGVIAEQPSGWKKELNRISWNGGEPKYDIRDWSSDHQKMGKGVTLTEAELRSLKVIIDEEIKLLDIEL